MFNDKFIKLILHLILLGVSSLADFFTVFFFSYGSIIVEHCAIVLTHVFHVHFSYSAQVRFDLVDNVFPSSHKTTPNWHFLCVNVCHTKVNVWFIWLNTTFIHTKTLSFCAQMTIFYSHSFTNISV